MSDHLFMEVLREFEMLDAKDVRVRLELNALGAMALIGIIQLATRHASFEHGPSRESALRLIADIQAQLDQHEIPNIRKLIDMGWNPENDVMTGGDP